MRKKMVGLIKVMAIAIFLATQILQANTISADSLVSNTYILRPGNAGWQQVMPRSFSIKNAEKTEFNVIEKTLSNLAVRQMSLYSEYLLLADNATKTPESLQRTYAEKMRKTSQKLITHLRKTLFSPAAKNGKRLARISQDEHTLKALFLLDRETVNPR